MSSIIKKNLKHSKRVIEQIFLKKDYTSVSEIKNYNLLKSDNKKVRINLMITSLRKSDVYAGIKSALDFFLNFSRYDVDLRILVMGQEVREDQLYSVPSFRITSNTEDYEGYSIVDITKPSSTFTIRENDYFLGTMWYTIYNANNFLEEQKRLFGKRQSLLYLIQDYEPGFFAWSSQYLLAESTYNIENQIVVFNSKYLKEYFDSHHYNFRKSYYFDPILNDRLSDILLSTTKLPERHNQIIIYGRPSKNRNAFELICMGLRRWAQIDPTYKKWQVFSAGEDIGDVKLLDDFVIKSLGKMTIDEYADIMLKSKVGISLMASPHPSYPPLEMATFGMKVITNSFETKNIGDFSDNILSLDHIDVDKLALALQELTKNKEFHISKNDNYIKGRNQIDNIIENITKDLGINQ